MAIKPFQTKHERDDRLNAFWYGTERT